MIGKQITATLAFFMVATSGLGYAQENIRACADSFVGETLEERLAADPETSQFWRLLQEANLDYLMDNNVFCHTVFAPSNDVLASIQINDDNRAAIGDILQYHIIGGDFYSLSFIPRARTTVRMLENSLMQIEMQRLAGTTLLNGKVKVLQTEVGGRGIVYKIDGLLSPDQIQQPNITEVIDGFPGQFENGFTPIGGQLAPHFYPVMKEITGKPGLSFLEIAETCGFADRLETETLTVFLPTGFSGRYGENPFFQTDRDFACRTFANSVLTGRHTVASLLELGRAGQSVKSITGTDVPVKIRTFRGREVVFVGDSNVQNGIQGGTNQRTSYFGAQNGNVLVASGFLIVR